MSPTMKRAIYVGKPYPWIRYGMTGIHWPDSFGAAFRADGDPVAVIVPRKDLYIPAEDQQRHCPKP